MKTALRTVRRLLDAIFVLLVITVLATLLFASAGPALGHQPLIIRGGSMTPAISLGTIVDVARVKPSELKVGDIVSVRAPNGVIDTHRISRTVSLPDGLYIETKGDANQTPDPVLAPVSSVVGRVDFQLPLLGYLMYMLMIPSGVAAIFCLALTLLLAIWLLEDLENIEKEDGGDQDEYEHGYVYESELARILDAARKSELARTLDAARMRELIR